MGVTMEIYDEKTLSPEEEERLFGTKEVFIERLKELLDIRGITRKQFLKDVGLNKDAFTNWKKNNTLPNKATLMGIASYFDVSIDYLLGELNEKDIIFFKIFKQLCEQRGTTPTALCKELGFSTAQPTHWKNGRVPNGKTLEEIANYFGVSVSYLLGESSKTNDGAAESSAEEKRLLSAFRNMTKEQKAALLILIEGYENGQ